MNNTQPSNFQRLLAHHRDQETSAIEIELMENEIDTLLDAEHQIKLTLPDLQRKANTQKVTRFIGKFLPKFISNMSHWLRQPTPITH